MEYAKFHIEWAPVNVERAVFIIKLFLRDLCVLCGGKIFCRYQLNGYDFVKKNMKE